MDSFICWDADSEDEPAADSELREDNTLVATTPEDAAKEYAKQLLYGGGLFHSVDVHVRAPDGAVYRVSVSVDWEPYFWAEKAKPVTASS